MREQYGSNRGKRASSGVIRQTDIDPGVQVTHYIVLLVWGKSF